jgi:hypothetical protein
MIELVRQSQPSTVAGVGKQVGRHLGHPAEFGVQHLLELRVAEARQYLLGPGRELDFHLEGRAVAGMAIRIAQAGERLVKRVPRRPEAVEIEIRRSDVAFRDLVECLATAGESAEIPVAVLVLNGLQLADHVVGAFLEPSISGRFPHQADRRQVMAGPVRFRSSPSHPS